MNNSGAQTTKFASTSSPMSFVTWDLWASMQPSFIKTSINTSGSYYGTDGVECTKCGRHYKLKSSLRNHQKWECGKEPQFKCPYCNYRAKQKMHVARHIERMHREKLDMLELREQANAANSVSPAVATQGIGITPSSLHVKHVDRLHKEKMDMELPEQAGLPSNIPSPALILKKENEVLP